MPSELRPKYANRRDNTDSERNLFSTTDENNKQIAPEAMTKADNLYPMKSLCLSWDSQCVSAIEAHSPTTIMTIPAQKVD